MRHHIRQCFLRLSFWTFFLTALAPPSVLVAQNISNQATTSRPIFLTATHGTALLLEHSTRQVQAAPLPTSRPVFEAFGMSRNGQWLLYRPLTNGIPSGELLLEERGGAARRLTPHLVLEAAWSPSDDDMVAFLYTTGWETGLAVLDLRTGVERTLVTGLLVAEFLRWSDAGAGLFYYQDLHVDDSFTPELRYVPLAPSTLRSSEAIPDGTPRIDDAAQQRLGQQERASGDGPRAIPFRILAPGRTHEVLGDKLFGDSILSVRPTSGGPATPLGQGVLITTLPTGAVIRHITSTGTQLFFVTWDGQETALSSLVTVDYQLPLAESMMVQGGILYPPPGNCSVIAHGGTLGYAYDFVGTDHIPVWASAPGLVVTAFDAAKCNTLPRYQGICPDYGQYTPANNNCPVPPFPTYLGNRVILEHADGTYTLYAHLEHDSIPVEVGDSVCQGTVIARQGHTGTSGTHNGSQCGDHLHFQRQPNAVVDTGTPVAVAFADVASNPLSCGTTYTSGIEPPLPYVLGSTSKILGQSGGTTGVRVNGSASCGLWTAESLVSWVEVQAPGQGLGDGTSALLVKPNGTNTTRTGTVMIAAQPVSILQTPGPAITSAQRIDNRLVLRGRDFEVSGAVVTVNGHDISGRIRLQTNTRIRLEGRNQGLHLVNGKNKIVVTVNGQDSNVHLLTLQIP